MNKKLYILRVHIVAIVKIIEKKRIYYYLNENTFLKKTTNNHKYEIDELIQNSKNINNNKNINKKMKMQLLYF